MSNEKRIPAAKIRAAWADRSKTVPQAAASLGVGASTLANWAKMMGLPPRVQLRGPKHAEIDLDQFRAMWAAGVRVKDMAEHFGRYQSSISTRAKRMGLAYRGKGFGDKTGANRAVAA